LIEQYDEIVSKYNVHINNAYKGRGSIILSANDGLKILKEVKLHEEKINFLYELKSELISKGLSVDNIIKSKEETLYVEYEDKKYILNEWSNGREVFLSAQNEIVLGIENLAQIHKATETVKSKIKYTMYDKTGSLLERLKKHNQELVRIKNNIRRTPIWSEFDILYLEAFDGYYQDALNATNEIREYYLRMIKKYASKRCCCHGQYNQHNLLLTSPQNIFTVNFEYAAYDSPVIELYSMMRKVLEKNDWQIKTGIQSIETYMKLNGMDKNELKVLCYLFMYPEKYWKISNYYASLNKAWKPKQSIVKLKKLLKQEASKKEFVSYLRSYVNH
jgi:CotS family spore coat protein